MKEITSGEIFAAIVLSWITEALFGAIIYYSGVWKSKEYKEKESRSSL